MTKTDHYHELGEAGNTRSNPYAHRFVMVRPAGAIPVMPNHFNFKKLFRKVAAVSTGGLSEVARNKAVQAVAKKAVKPLAAISTGGLSQIAMNKKVQAVVKQSVMMPKTVAGMVKKTVQTHDPIAAARTMAPANLIHSIKQLKPLRQ